MHSQSVIIASPVFIRHERNPEVRIGGAMPRANPPAEPVAGSLGADALRFLKLSALISLGAFALFILFIVTLYLVTKRDRDWERAKLAEQEEQAAKVRRAKLHAKREREHELRAGPEWPDLVLDHVLRWLLTPRDPLSPDWLAVRQYPGALLTETEINQATDRAAREGLAVHDGRRWRLTRRGSRIFEEFSGDRKRMEEAEKKRHRPQVMIDARGAGTVAHTIEGGVHGTTVNNAATATPIASEVDLQAVLQLVEQLRTALAATGELSDLAQRRASGDLSELDRELRAPDDEREPGRVRAALERLRDTLVGADGLAQLVNQLWDHVHHWFPA
jgi:hypothetical protein